MSGRLAGKRIAILGAGQTHGDTEGNGRAMARIFSHEGADLLLVDRDEAAARATADICSGPNEILVADVAEEGAADRIAEAAKARLGGLDGLVYNIGIGGGGDGPAGKVSDDAWDRIMLINLTAARRTMGALIPLLRDSGHGAIVAISSLASIAPSPMISYSVSKAGMNRLVQSVAFHEAAHQVRCNAITPGLIDTPMAIEGHSKASGIDKDALRKGRDRAVPIGHMGQAEDVAFAALYLMSDEAKVVTGVILPVDGGSSVKVAI